MASVSIGSFIIHTTIKFTRRAIVLDRITTVQAMPTRQERTAWVMPEPDARTRAMLRGYWSA